VRERWCEAEGGRERSTEWVNETGIRRVITGLTDSARRKGEGKVGEENRSNIQRRLFCEQRRVVYGNWLGSSAQLWSAMQGRGLEAKDPDMAMDMGGAALSVQSKNNV
jgi:hypothetical protein